MTHAPRVTAGPWRERFVDPHEGRLHDFTLGAFDNIPAGMLDVIVRTGKAAGEVVIQPLSAPIGRVFVQTESAGDENNIVTIAAEEVALRVIQWDIDGHTDYPGMPKAVFLDSGGKSTGRIIMDVVGEKKLHVNTNSNVLFQGFQFKISGLELSQLRGQTAGCMRVYGDDGNRLTIELPGAGGWVAAKYVLWKNRGPGPDGVWGWGC